jgi:hypothetical protein
MDQTVPPGRSIAVSGLKARAIVAWGAAQDTAPGTDCGLKARAIVAWGAAQDTAPGTDCGL